ncbi:cilia- and flagella-associated protein 206 isoform X1 [Hippoglossus hippoglossus]|uniref:cilia- and flagella-associated protein 206 isoform X1 n=1 Tax=Hippoglossus hippoglossus TaxID=8267 RepID=UPI00148D07F1|nr:cilia- and flagella-associated protein 206 isoform X1 [Hippoglossus hippoglossus]XP_034447319.1 cilia- and flagella-associated protein 206 isoform X1 [Hippoglossus hippoglossus]XP_034447321.1 cilia- and flagella-associated protein 206 isoform X1 [Hippoglossus hippoglossus]
MSRAHAENVIKNIIREIVQECAVRGQVVSDTLVAFMVKAVVLDPRNGFNVDRTLTKQDVQKLEELCLDKLMEKCSPSLDTIKMQVYFDINYTSRREFLEEIQRVVDSRLSPVSRDITDSRVKTREELDALYRKIITYIVLRSGMGSPTDDNTLQEATAALQSVFPPTELGTFMVLLKKEKEKQLNELTMIVTGIRIFNKASRKRGEETDLRELMPDVLNGSLPVISNSIEKELSASQSLAWKYTAVLEKLTDSDHQPEELDVSSVLLKQALYNIRQHEVFLKMLLADACLCAKHVEFLQTELSSQMKLLKETVQSKTAVPTANVFPLFKALSDVWSGLRDEAELLSILNNIKLSLQPLLTSQANIFSEAYLDDLLEASEVKTDEQRLTESSDECIIQAEMKTQEWLLPEATTSFNDLLLQYNGVCGYTLVNRDGLLLPGNPHIGVMRHKEKLYAFSSKEAALKFASRPDDFIAEVAEKAKLSPELIQLLKLHQQFSCVSPYSEMQPGESLLVKPITKCESSTQTDLHPVETNIVKSYEWNEWELRRKAIRLANLRTKVTHSAQTDLSHMRRENITQTWLPKDAACQSKRDGESNMPRPQVYLAGLRGQRDGHMVKTNLTRSVDE